MDCPRCGATAVTTPECPACGVLVAKARPGRTRAERPAPAPPAAWRSLVLPGIGFALLAAAAVVYLRRPANDGPRESGTPERPGALATAAPDEPALPLPTRAAPAPPPPLRLGSASGANPQDEADMAAAQRLIERLKTPGSISAEDVRVAEGLYARHAQAVESLLVAVLLAAAARERDARRFDAAEALVDRAVDVSPASAVSRGALRDVRLGQGDWAGAEAAGRAALALAPDDAIAAQGLAMALVRQDRTREAVELLDAFLEKHPDAATRALRDRFHREQATVRSLEEAKLAHFHVRFDGDAHEEVGREILRLLERHYATLARSFDYQPSQPIPVILLARDSYYTATGAPAWSGGQYDSFDGRVRIPIGGLSASLPPELDATLVHELTHSFVADLSRASAPRELHEGLAQHMEGRRMSQLDADTLRALADGRLPEVSRFYFGALWLVEDLLAARGQGGINDVLRALSTTGVDEAFRGVYGRDFAGLQADARLKLRQRYGS